MQGYFNEMDPGKPTERFYRELGAHLDEIDPYRHLRSTSDWGYRPQDWKLPSLDLADEHFYLRPSDYQEYRDEVDAVLDRVAILKRHAPDRPVLLGEFGLADKRWRITDQMKERAAEMVDTSFHNSLWASALSGASGTGITQRLTIINQSQPLERSEINRIQIGDIPTINGIHAGVVEVDVLGDEMHGPIAHHKIRSAGMSTAESFRTGVIAGPSSTRVVQRNADSPQHVVDPTRTRPQAISGSSPKSAAHGIPGGIGCSSQTWLPPTQARR